MRARCYDVSIDPRVGDACNLDFPSESFDVVASSCVIEHVPDKRAMVREVMRVLRPGGLALIKAPQRFSLKHLKSDPHYQYAGVSVLPAPVASWYLTTFRGEAVYEVETLPTGRLIRKLFREEGGIVLDDRRRAALTSGRRDGPDQVRCERPGRRAAPGPGDRGPQALAPRTRRIPSDSVPIRFRITGNSIKRGQARSLAFWVSNSAGVITP